MPQYRCGFDRPSQRKSLRRHHAAKIGGTVFKVNVADDDSVDAGIAGAEAAHGVARVLVNCAGVGSAMMTVGKMKTVGKENVPHAMGEFRKVVEINLIGTFNAMSKFAARAMTLDVVGEERGVIINTASVAAYDGQVG